MGLFTSKAVKKANIVKEEQSSMSDDDFYNFGMKISQDLEERIEKYGRSYLTDEEKQEYETGTFTIEVDGEKYTFGWKDVATTFGFYGREHDFDFTYNTKKGKRLIKKILENYIHDVNKSNTFDSLFTVVSKYYSLDIWDYMDADRSTLNPYFVGMANYKKLIKLSEQMKELRNKGDLEKAKEIAKYEFPKAVKINGFPEPGVEISFDVNNWRVKKKPKKKR